MNRLLKTISLIFLGTIAIASCDKIDNDNYIVFSGVEGEWLDGNGVEDHSQRAIIEKYTGVRCVNCPTADSAIYVAQNHYGDKLIAIAIHDSSTFTTPYGDNPCLSTPDGQAWSVYFGVRASGAYPNALVNRTLNGTSWDLFPPTSGINSRVDVITNSPATVALQVNATRQESTITITVDVELLNSITDKMTLTLLIIEDSINATQKMPDGTPNHDYIHNHVLRDVITDVWGTDIACEGNSGEKRMALFTYSANAEWDLNNCHIVAFVSDKESRQIINVAECEIEQ